ncbi:hypothetical protein NE237_009526 [Protea cynaroides]|uniref:Nuclear speckle splicing regulatory protein 1 N-terminal domain-containing protein n=1 Tax=Protea cynaroides TaxID=273540 RepID=A0A9Q0KY00_9MAGN|nr:hypothetical protein NE237_009526 [Protea cynaroides]
MKYGLQLRVQPSQQKKQPARPSILPAPGFDDDDEDHVEKEIARHATKNKSLKDPKYIQTLTEKAKEREQVHEIVYEKKLIKERSKDDHLYAGKDKFVTSAYKKKLAEQAKWLEEEQLRELREEKEDILGVVWLRRPGNQLGVQFMKAATLPFVRINLWIDTHLPLCQGTTLNSGGLTTLVSFKFEKLDVFYYFCRHLNHPDVHCLSYFEWLANHYRKHCCDGAVYLPGTNVKAL